ncbi:MAG: arsenate reductase ArsC [Actinomycetota bacterium]
MRILILCTGNSCRSQMAEGFFRKYRSKWDVNSAGIMPSRVHPFAIEVMEEVGIDISSHRSKSVDEFMGQDFDYVITVCDNARESCPVFPGKVKMVHWSFRDPASVIGSREKQLEAFRTIRDEIEKKIKEFLRGEEI